MLQQFKLIDKKNLTHNVFEMVFKWDNELKMKSWQFVTFLLEKIWWRAYSILKIDWNNIVLIIKKRELDEWWRWWSKLICELSIWDELKWVWPAGHFILKENNKSKLFIWTGTWLVPLYNMIICELEKKSENKIKFIFWVREETDTFYIDELEKIKKQYSNFEFEIYISRVKDLHRYQNEHPNIKINSWYTTNNLLKKNTSEFKEVYICWAPTMIEWAIEKLINLWFIENETIFYEKY